MGITCPYSEYSYAFPFFQERTGNEQRLLTKALSIGTSDVAQILLAIRSSLGNSLEASSSLPLSGRLVSFPPHGALYADAYDPTTPLPPADWPTEAVVFSPDQPAAQTAWRIRASPRPATHGQCHQGSLAETLHPRREAEQLGALPAVRRQARLYEAVAVPCGVPSDYAQHAEAAARRRAPEHAHVGARRAVRHQAYPACEEAAPQLPYRVRRDCPARERRGAEVPASAALCGVRGRRGRGVRLWG